MKLKDLKNIILGSSLNYSIYKNYKLMENYINCCQNDEEEIIKEYGKYNVICVRADTIYINDEDEIPESILEIYLED